ncbi:MAG TPA: hypothetical protein VIH38_13655, partial [Steroidobacteraceae bacterium]
KLDALRVLAAKLGRQLKSTEPDAEPRSALRAPRRTMLGRRQIAIAVAAVAVLTLAALGLLFWGMKSREVASVSGTEQSGATVNVRPPARAPAAPADIPAITKAMSDCDAAAASDPDSLYFLVLPMRPADPADRSWSALALQTVGSSYLLLSAKDALDGLRNNRLTLRPDRYTFSALDTESGQTYSWTSATGMSRLSRRESGATKSLKLGFDFSEQQAGAQWSAEFKRERGICYWLSALIRD